RWHFVAAIHVATGHRAGHVMAVGHQRRYQAIGMTSLCLYALVAFVHRPAIVLAARARRRLVVDFLPARITDVGDPHVAVGAVEAEAPRIAEPVRPDFPARARHVHE